MSSTAERLGLTVEEMRATCGVPPQCGSAACRLSCCCYFRKQSAPNPPAPAASCETCGKRGCAKRMIDLPATVRVDASHCSAYEPPRAGMRVPVGKSLADIVTLPPKAGGEKPLNHIEAERPPHVGERPATYFDYWTSFCARHYGNYRVRVPDAEWQDFCSRLSVVDGVIHYAGEPQKETEMVPFEVVIVRVGADASDQEIVFVSGPVLATSNGQAEKKALLALVKERAADGLDELDIDDLMYISRPFGR